MKNLYKLSTGARFLYGGVEWIKLDANGDETLCLAAESVFEQAFDDGNKNDWRKSSLRRELNGPFLDRLVQAGADSEAFMVWESDLTADDGMTDYGTAADKIALLSCDLYRKYRAIIPQIEKWWLTLTPWTCTPKNSHNVLYVNSDGALTYYSAYSGYNGVRPLCNQSSDIWVSIPCEKDDTPMSEATYARSVENAKAAILGTLEEHPLEIWGEALGRTISTLLRKNSKSGDLK